MNEAVSQHSSCSTFAVLLAPQGPIVFHLQCLPVPRWEHTDKLTASRGHVYAALWSVKKRSTFFHWAPELDNTILMYGYSIIISLHTPTTCIFIRYAQHGMPAFVAL